MPSYTRCAFLLAALLAAGCASGGGAGSTSRSSSASTESSTAARVVPETPASRVVTTPSGLQVEDLRVGDGALAETGMEVLVHYTGWFTDGTKFESSIDRQKPLNFRLGSEVVIPGWEEGIQGMRVGGKRKLIVPPDLAYGSQGRAGTIPPNATLVFEIELLDLR